MASPSPRANTAYRTPNELTKELKRICTESKPNRGGATSTNHAVQCTQAGQANYTGGTVMKCAKGGCASNPTPMASGQSSPYGIAVDSTSVYWTTLGSGGSTGTVMKLVKQ